MFIILFYDDLQSQDFELYTCLPDVFSVMLWLKKSSQKLISTKLFNLVKYVDIILIPLVDFCSVLSNGSDWGVEAH